MAKRSYYRTAALLGAQPGATKQHRQAAQPVRIPWRILLVIVLLAAVALWIWLDARWYVDATRLQVAGASLETSRQVALAGEVLGLHGLWLQSGEIVTKVLTTVPAVVDAEADCWFYPAQCVIMVEERVPVLAWITEEGNLYWVAADGMLFAAQGERPELPLVRGPLPDSVQIPVAILEGVDALVSQSVPLDELEYNPSRGLFWNDSEGRLVCFGTGIEMDARWHVYQRLVADFEARGLFPWIIDVRFPQAPTYSMERSW